MGRSNADIGKSLESDVAGVLLERDRISTRVGELALEITNWVSRSFAESGEAELSILAVLTGSLVFLSDLIRRIPLKIRVSVVSASSYQGSATTPGQVFLGVLPRRQLIGKKVLVVDDILDTGRTLEAVLELARSQRPEMVRSCVLLTKTNSLRPESFCADFSGFDIERDFVVGYGLDYDGLYRNLPDICVLKPEVFVARKAYVGQIGDSSR